MYKRQELGFLELEFRTDRFHLVEAEVHSLEAVLQGDGEDAEERLHVIGGDLLREWVGLGFLLGHLLLGLGVRQQLLAFGPDLRVVLLDPIEVEVFPFVIEHRIRIQALHHDGGVVLGDVLEGDDGGVAGAGLGADSIASYKVYMPAYQGTFVFKYTTGTMSTTAKSAVDRTVSVDVVAADGGAAAAAAEEATAAANDATDAALSAAEAAEAATAMAQEAVDAVAELSASVTKLISALRAQITTLTNLVVKIQKKVKA